MECRRNGFGITVGLDKSNSESSRLESSYHNASLLLVVDIIHPLAPDRRNRPRVDTVRQLPNTTFISSPISDFLLGQDGRVESVFSPESSDNARLATAVGPHAALKHDT